MWKNITEIALAVPSACKRNSRDIGRLSLPLCHPWSLSGFPSAPWDLLQVSLLLDSQSPPLSFLSILYRVLMPNHDGVEYNFYLNDVFQLIIYFIHLIFIKILLRVSNSVFKKILERQGQNMFERLTDVDANQDSIASFIRLGTGLLTFLSFCVHISKNGKCLSLWDLFVYELEVTVTTS